MDKVCSKCKELKQLEDFYVCKLRKDGKQTSCKLCSKQRQKEAHPLSIAMRGMKTRCYNQRAKHYKDYGGRGIVVCDEWLKDSNSFVEWGIVNGWKDSLSIDRIDNNGNYEPSNCRFASSSVNAKNTRKSKWWVIEGIRYASSSDASNKLGVSRRTIRHWCNISKENCYSELKYQ